MFLEFFYNLRAHGLKATTHNWLALMEALARGLHGESLSGFYEVARCILITNEAHYDEFDRAFAETFKGVKVDAEAILESLEEWLANPKRLEYLDPELRAALQSLDIDELRRQFAERLAQQKGRHEGGNRWIGTGGTSPFGSGGQNPSGVRIGGGGGRSALAVADARRFRELRRDLVLDTRQIAAALRRLRKLSRDEGDPELDIDGTIDATARNCGDLEVKMQPPRRNAVRLLLLLDVGGSMDPHAELVSRLFSAAHQGGNFRELRSYYFHNCVYGSVYEDARFSKPVPTQELITSLDARWFLVIVGDAYMHPGELMMSGGDWWMDGRGPSGMTWLARLASRFPRSAWLNPEPTRLWATGTIAEVAAVYPMFQLTLDGLEQMVRHLRRPPSPDRAARVARLAQTG
ncbi:MAG: VWA domain-containing protein [Myxococcales bacterium]|nr:VWA domain-containing protein [Myxococcales bacterium]